MTPTDQTPTLAAQIEVLEAESNHDDFATRHSARVNLRHLLGDNLPAIVTALRQAEAAPGVVEALERVLSATTLRALRGRDHVPSMREEQDACSQARAALALARQHGAREQWQGPAYEYGHTWGPENGPGDTDVHLPAAPATDVGEK